MYRRISSFPRLMFATRTLQFRGTLLSRRRRHPTVWTAKLALLLRHLPLGDLSWVRVVGKKEGTTLRLVCPFQDWSSYHTDLRQNRLGCRLDVQMLAILHLTIDLVTKITAIVPTASPARSALYSIPPIPTNPSWSLLEMMEATLLPPLRYSAAQKSFFNPFLPIKEIIRRDQRGTIRNLKGEIDYSMSFVLTLFGCFFQKQFPEQQEPSASLDGHCALRHGTVVVASRPRHPSALRPNPDEQVFGHELTAFDCHNFH